MALPSFIQLYNEFISIPTISSLQNSELDHSNRSFIDRLAHYLSELGFSVTIEEVPQTRQKFNLLAQFIPEQQSTETAIGGLLLTGHSDTVPFDEALWHSDPFSVTEKNGRWYGLGTADMKGFFAFILEALKSIDLKSLQKPLSILITADEEITMAGAAHFARHHSIQPDCIIVGEPTSLIPIRAHKGFTSNGIQVVGRSGHSSDPDSGLNAIEIMHQVITLLLQLKETLKTSYHNGGFQIPYQTMNLATIHGGDAANRICGCCDLVLDIRPLPDMKAIDIKPLIISTLAPLMARYPDAIRVVSKIDPIQGYECDAHDPMLCLVEQITSQRAQTVNYSTEAPYLQSIAPTIILGPGSIAQAHQPDEFISMDQFQPTLDTLQRLIHQFCL